MNMSTLINKNGSLPIPNGYELLNIHEMDMGAWFSTKIKDPGGPSDQGNWPNLSQNWPKMGEKKSKITFYVSIFFIKNPKWLIELSWLKLILYQNLYYTIFTAIFWRILGLLG